MVRTPRDEAIATYAKATAGIIIPTKRAFNMPPSLLERPWLLAVWRRLGAAVALLLAPWPSLWPPRTPANTLSPN